MKADFLILAFCGPSNAGKYTLGNRLEVSGGFLSVGFKDVISAEVGEAFGVHPQSLESASWKNRQMRLLRISSCQSPEYREILKAGGYDMEEPRTSSFHLHHWAHSYRKIESTGYAINQMYHLLLAARSEGIKQVVVFDVNNRSTELTMLRMVARHTGGTLKVIHVVRDGSKPNLGHSGPREDEIDFTLHNGTGRLALAVATLKQYAHNLKATT